jgi:hypothetical protein
MQGTNGLPPFYGSTAISTSPTVHATFNTATNDGKYSGYYQVPSTPSPTGYTHYLYASYVQKGGLYATYYTPAFINDKDIPPVFNAPVDVSASSSTLALTKMVTKDGLEYTLTTAAAASGPWINAASGILSSTATDPFIIRYSGMYKPTATQMYFVWDLDGLLEDRVRLWVDDKLIIDQWISLASSTPSSSYLFDSSTGIYDFHAELYRRAAFASNQPKLKHGTTSSVTSVIPTDNMYTQEKISGSPYAVTVSA